VFSDNAKIKHVMASRMPGQFLSAGKHHVLYRAFDEEDNEAKCEFTVHVISEDDLELRNRR